jgi:pimeloyl-ACP methyl ester carboxylesterase
MFESFHGLVACLALVGVAATTAVADAGAAPKARKSVVLVHGAFADGSSWDRVVPLLEDKGYEVIAVHQPFTSFAEDVAATRRVIDAQAGDVVLVGHSYGGAVITEAGNNPKVTALVYVAAFGPDAGESINDLGKGQPAPPWVSELRVDAGGFGSLPARTVAQDFAQDLPPAEVRLLAAKQGPIAVKNFDQKIIKAAWHDRPVFYLRATDDHMIAPAAQQAMASRMHSKMTSVAASHVPMLSKPEAVANVVLAAAQVTRAKQ